MWSCSSGESVCLRPFWWFSACSAIAVLLCPIGVRCLPSESVAKRSTQSAGDSEVVDYLKKFGYLSESSGESANSLILNEADALETAIKSLQSFANLPVTGKVDKKTLELLKSPRCGLPDNPSSSDSHRTKRSVPKSHITWSVNTAWRDLPAHLGLVRRQLHNAFNVWQRNANVRFTEKDIGQQNTDISISFAKGDHGDRYPFDGKGKTLAHAYALQSSNEGIEGDVHFDNDEEWTVDERISKGISLFSVAVHELGHSLGLKHVDDKTSVMFPLYQELGNNFELPRYDRDQIQRIYGPPTGLGDPRIRPSEHPAAQPQPNPPVKENVYPKHADPRQDTPNPCAPHLGYPCPRTPYDPAHRNPPFNPDYPPKPASPSYPDQPRYPVSPVRPATRADVTPPASPPTPRKEPKADEPDACNTSYDAISVMRGEMFIFKGKYFWRFRDANNLKSHSGPTLITQLWKALPRDLTRVDAFYQRSSDENKIVFFIGQQMYQFDGGDLDPGYPKPITSLRLDPSVDHIDAALVWGHNKRTYLFSGRSYWRLTKDETSIELDYPKDMSEWSGIGYNIDAAFQWTDGATYFFKGKGFWKFNDRRMQVQHERLSYSAPFWMGCGRSSGFGPRGQFLTDGDLKASYSNIPPSTNIIPLPPQTHKNPSNPSPFGPSSIVIACIAVLVALLIVLAVAIVVRRRHKRHSYQQPKWLKVNKKILM